MLQPAEIIHFSISKDLKHLNNSTNKGTCIQLSLVSAQTVSTETQKPFEKQSVQDHSKKS